MSDDTWPLDTAFQPAAAVYREPEAEGSDVPLSETAQGLLHHVDVVANLERSWAAAGKDAAMVGALNIIAGGLQLQARLALLVDMRLSDALGRMANTDAWGRRELARMEERHEQHLGQALDEQRADVEAVVELYTDAARDLYTAGEAQRAVLIRRMETLERRLGEVEARLRGWQVVAVLLVGIALGALVT